MRSLRVDGAPVGEVLEPAYGTPRREKNAGSIITIVATDAPLLSSQLVRICKRAALGIGRLGSFAAHIGAKGSSIYSASKGALIPAARALAQEVGARQQIRVNVINASYVETPMTRTMKETVLAEGESLYVPPLGPGQPADVANGAMFLLETYVNNVVGSVEETVRMFAAVDHQGLGLLMDPTNYFESHNIDRMDQVLNQVFDTLGDRIKIAHAKDVKRSGGDTSEKHADIGDEDALESHTFRGVGAIELPAPGLGSLNYDLYLRRLARKHPNIPIIIEHLDETDVPRAKKFLDGKLRANGL